MRQISLFFLILSVLFLQSNALRILGIFPFPSKSHFAVGNGLIESLAEAGHDITVLSPYPKKSDRKNHRYIDASKVLEVFENEDDETNPFIFGRAPAIATVVMLTKINVNVVDLFMSNSEVIKFLDEDNQYDVCLFERFLIDGLLGIVEKSNCVLIDFVAFAESLWIDDMTGNISPLSYVPNGFLDLTDRMTFGERLWNTFFSLLEKGVYYGYYLPKHRNLYKKYFPNAHRSFDEVYMNASIIFLNTHVSSNTVRPNMPNVIEVGGVHIKEAKQLPKDIQQFLDTAKEGVILFSMGSFIQSKKWPIDKRNAFVRAFGKLKQKVLWKYENETLPGNPGNIMISSWIPQRDILAHPNVKMFITHGGLLGTTEAVAEGVPVLGIPIFGDQKLNMAKSELRGYGLRIDFDEVTEENILSSITKMLENPKYKDVAVEISKRFRDRPMTAQQSVRYWTEYAARHAGAKHLKGEGLRMNSLQLNSIDVYGVFLIGILIAMYVKLKILQFVLGKISKKKAPKVKNS